MSALGERLKALIAADGPMSVEAFMQAALYDPEHGYYVCARPLGADGDFTTAPEISQIFGEMIGLWLVQSWLDLGAPSAFHLVELGPGRGTLMADALRAAKVRPAFLAAARLVLVEVNPHLRAAQAVALGDHGPSWVANLAEVPDGPMLLVANEFLDCLPIRQFVRDPDGWREKLVGLGPDGALSFGLSPLLPAPAVLTGAPGAVAEVAPGLAPLAADIARRLCAAPGRALFIDYGYGAPEGADTLQALARHEKVSPLAAPGQADLTAHVDFGALARALTADGAVVEGSIGQGAFLTALGARARLAQLSAAQPDKAAMLARGLDRLIAEEQMGALFLALAASSPGALRAPGFEPHV
jgi:NADH dehydrogenase [ubiquinone] 1 alpha subcomplex assembly factor 7